MAIKVPEALAPANERWLNPGERFEVPVEPGPNGRPQTLVVSLRGPEVVQPGTLESHLLYVTKDDGNMTPMSVGDRITLTVDGISREYQARLARWTGAPQLADSEQSPPQQEVVMSTGRLVLVSTAKNERPPANDTVRPPSANTNAPASKATPPR